MEDITDLLISPWFWTHRFHPTSPPAKDQRCCHLWSWAGPLSYLCFYIMDSSPSEMPAKRRPWSYVELSLLEESGLQCFACEIGIQISRKVICSCNVWRCPSVSQRNLEPLNVRTLIEQWLLSTPSENGNVDDDDDHIDAGPPSVSALQTATTGSTSLVASSTTSFTSAVSTPLSPVVVPSTSSRDCGSLANLTHSVDSTTTTTSPSISTVVVPCVRHQVCFIF